MNVQGSLLTCRSAVICMFCLVMSCQIRGQPAPRADAVWDQANIVAFGQVISAKAKDTGQRARGGYLGVVTKVEIVLKTARCYKNSDDSGCTSLISFFYDWPQLNNTSPRLVVGDAAVVFLMDHDGKLTAEDPDGVWPLANLVQSRGGQKPDLAPQGKIGLQNDLSSALASSTGGDLRRNAFFYLRGFTTLSPQVMEEAKRIALLDSVPIDERLAALDLMLTDPKCETVAIVARIAATEGKAVIASPAANEVGQSLRNVSEASCVPDLIKILESKVENWHYGAISGLRKIGSDAAVPALMRALDDPEPLARYAAMITLFEVTKMTNGEAYGPGMGPFEEDPDKYVRRWKQWWADEGKAKYDS